MLPNYVKLRIHAIEQLETEFLMKKTKQFTQYQTP